MKKDISNKLIWVCVLAAAFGCKSKKELVKTTIQAPRSTPAASVVIAVPLVNNANTVLLTNITAANANFNTLAIKAKANLKIEKRDDDVTMNFRIRKDQAIWVSVTAPVIGEVARALITPDSVKIINRIENSYTKKPFSFINQFTNDQINYKMLQAVLTGNAIAEFTGTEAKIQLLNGLATLSGVNAGLVYSTSFNSANKPLQLTLTNAVASQALTVKYADVSTESGLILPHNVNFNSVVSDKNIRLELKYTKVTVNESVEMPFSPPKRFVVKQ